MQVPRTAVHQGKAVPTLGQSEAFPGMDPAWMMQMWQQVWEDGFNAAKRAAAAQQPQMPPGMAMAAPALDSAMAAAWLG